MRVRNKTTCAPDLTELSSALDAGTRLDAAADQHPTGRLQLAL